MLRLISFLCFSFFIFSASFSQKVDSTLMSITNTTISTIDSTSQIRHESSSIVRTKYATTISLHSKGIIESNSIKNAFSDKFLFGGQINNDLKNQNKLRNNNKISGVFQYKIIGKNIINFKNEWRLNFETSDQHLFGLNFNPSTYNAAFYGNQSLDSVAYLDMNFRYTHYQKLAFTLSKKFESSYFEYGISLFNTSKTARLSTNKFELITEENYTSLTANFDGTFRQSDTSKNNYLQQNGIGFGINALSSIPLKNDYSVLIFIKDFGLLFWNDESLNVSKNGTYQFDGIYFNGLNDDVNFNVRDSLLKNADKKSFIELSYFQFYASINKQWSDKANSTVGLYYFHYLNYIPKLILESEYKVNKVLSIEGGLNFGGFSLFKSQLAMNLSFKRFKFQIGSNNLHNTILANGIGRDIHFTITKAL